MTVFGIPLWLVILGSVSAVTVLGLLIRLGAIEAFFEVIVAILEGIFD